MVGLDKFKDAFEAYSDNYVIIGGTACEITLKDTEMRPRATHDIDMIVIIENMTPEFGSRFWDFIHEGGYRPEKRSNSNGRRHKYELYRFLDGKDGYPEMIELLSRHPNILGNPKGIIIEPLPIDENVSSLSAIIQNNAMKIQYASDLHLEFAENWSYLKEHPLKVTGDVLVLAGDIGYLGDDNYIKHPFWDWASDNYEQVICCMGNHEFYKHYDIATLKDGSCLEIRWNVHSYYNVVTHIENVDFIVSTLWAEIPLNVAYYTEQVISDFHRILYNGEFLSFADFNREHKRCFGFIKDAVKSSTAKHKIVVTHHVPSFRMQCPKFVDSLANGAFIVELENYIKDSGIDFWIFGHSHYNVDAVIGKTDCFSNQLGYVFNGENISFDSGKHIEI